MSAPLPTRESDSDVSPTVSHEHENSGELVREISPDAACIAHDGDHHALEASFDDAIGSPSPQNQHVEVGSFTSLAKGPNLPRPHVHRRCYSVDGGMDVQQSMDKLLETVERHDLGPEVGSVRGQHAQSSPSRLSPSRLRAAATKILRSNMWASQPLRNNNTGDRLAGSLAVLDKISPSPSRRGSEASDGSVDGDNSLAKVSPTKAETPTQDATNYSETKRTNEAKQRSSSVFRRTVGDVLVQRKFAKRARQSMKTKGATAEDERQVDHRKLDVNTTDTGNDGIELAPRKYTPRSEKAKVRRRFTSMNAEYAATHQVAGVLTGSGGKGWRRVSSSEIDDAGCASCTRFSRCCCRMYYPFETFPKYWDMFILLLLVYCMWEIPLRLGLMLEIDVMDPFWAFSLCVDIFFLFDCINNLGWRVHVDKKGYVIDTQPAAAKFYLRTWFTVDFISSLPIASFYELLLVAGDSNVDSTSLLIRVPAVLRAFRSIRLVKLLRSARLCGRQSGDSAWRVR